MLAERLRKAFIDRYRSEPRLFAAPGRVNLIGEHTDYNEGFVLPMALERAAMVALRKRDDRRVGVTSLTLGKSAEFDLDSPSGGLRGSWVDFVEGVAQTLIAKGASLSGADIVLDSDVPRGAGLASSAALEVSVGLGLLSIENGATIDRVSLALAAQQAEHQYVGTRCGIMDQYIAALGQKGHALLIDCRSLETQAIRLPLEGISVVVCNTRAPHDLATSEYNLRRSQCERALHLLQRFLPNASALRDVTPALFAEFEAQLPEPLRRRCRHVVTENERTQQACSALRASDLEQFGHLMQQSHISLRDDYEVSSRELDLAVEVASAEEGVLGARMTGGGFGGCTVNLVRDSSVQPLLSALKAKFGSDLGYEPELFVTRAGQGACELTR